MARSVDEVRGPLRDDRRRRFATLPTLRNTLTGYRRGGSFTAGQVQAVMGAAEASLAEILGSTLIREDRENLPVFPEIALPLEAFLQVQ